jgi:uncharacterized phosphosugar-binding protein
MGLSAPAAPRAAAYHQWLMGCLDETEKDLPAITASAEQAADAYLRDGCEIGAFGDGSIVGEFNSRAGGLMRTTRPEGSMRTKPSEALDRADWKGIVLFFPRETSLADDLDKARRFLEQGKLVIGFGGPAVRQAAAEAKVNWTSFIDTHAAPHGGLFATKDGAWLVPTDPTANIVAVWTWTGEFVGALTRRGKMPAMYQSVKVPGAMERNKPFENLKFHEATPTKVAAGDLARQYLQQLRRSLTLLRDHDLGAVRRVAEQAQAAQKAGRRTHIFTHGHSIRFDIGIPHDPGFFHQVNRGLFDLREDHGVAQGDFVFCLGYDMVFKGWYFGDVVDRLRATGASLAWSMTDYNQDPVNGPAAIPAGETIIWQHWAMGDAVATVPGYDVKILPTSGVIAEAILWMVQSEMLSTSPCWSEAK